jgi:hypothetical protein
VSELIPTEAMVDTAKSILDRHDLEFCSDGLVRDIVKSMLTAALATLRAEGWTVIAPVDPAIPDPAVGQVWVSPSAKIEPRTVTKLAPHRWYPSGDTCVYFTTPSGRATSLHPATWRLWARKSRARPQTATTKEPTQ